MSGKHWLAGALLALLIAAVPAALAAPKPHARAEATVARGSEGVFRQVEASGDEAQSASGAIEEQSISIHSSEARVTASLGEGRARATAVARTVKLFDGLVTAYGVRRTAEAAKGETTYTGAVRGLQVDGRMIGDVLEPATYEFPGGRVTVNTDTAGLLVVFDDDRSLAVADVSATARAAPRPSATPTAAPKPTPEAAKRKRKQKKKEQRKPPARLIDSTDHVFPVGGQASVADDFFGPRQIGPHQGNDVFAPFGTPVVAVADGLVHKVGTLPISGNRLWLRTDEGDEFFYAHMASFSPRAENGERVKAGTVLGFVGNTGDAEPTPPHLHFEIHPGGMEEKAVDPQEVLLAWQAGAGSLHRFGLDPAARPGTLVEVRDFLAE
jgi:murein DD-endopeptidase MepM/ murein hydrolase activator NlpD